MATRSSLLSLAPAIARVDGMPHLVLIFLHSMSAVGCNSWRCPSVSSDLKIASKEQLLAPMRDAVASGSTEAA
jgi:hypothetical protein